LATSAPTVDAPGVQAADKLFEAGKFADAKKIYAKALAADSTFHVNARLGSIALFSNHLGEAERSLQNALAIKPDSLSAKVLLAEVYIRRDDYAKAAPLYRALGQEARAKQLESFARVTTYEIHWNAPQSILGLVDSDPLPVVAVRVNDSKEVNFLIDTGTAEVILDPDFAEEVGAKLFGSQMGSFPCGRKAAVQNGRIDSLTLHQVVIKNLPVDIVPTRPLSRAMMGGKRIDGIIGTVLLRHFLATLDYPKEKLVLRPKTQESLARLEKDVHPSVDRVARDLSHPTENSSARRDGKCYIIPFWMAHDHFMVAWGTLDKSPPLLLFVDTGLAGAGVAAPKSVLDKAGIKLEEDKAGQALGGAGKFRIVPFVVKHMTLGDAAQQNVRGLYIGTLPFAGFKIGGFVSHEFFRHYAVTFDFTGMRMFLQKPE
jgi:predicted aspartyl protease